jgi:hypothetical protein
VFDALDQAIRELSVPADRDALAEAIALRDRLDAKIAAAIGAYAAAGQHELDGSLTMGAWLRHHARLDPTSASAEARRAAKLQRLPVLRRAFETGELSAGAVAVVLARVPARHLDRFAEHETELVAQLAELDIEQVALVMATWQQRADALDPGPAPLDRTDALYLHRSLDGRGALHGELGPDLTTCWPPRCGSRIRRTSTCPCPSGVPPPSGRCARRSSTSRSGSGAAGTARTSP